MITINLISAAKKKELKLTQFYLILKNMIILILLFSSVLSMILLLTKLSLQRHFEEVVATTTLTTQYANVFGTDVREFNKLVTSIDSVQKNYINWGEFIIDFTKIVPPGVAINKFNIIEGKIFIKGFASTRNDLLEFKDAIEQSDLLSNPELPIDDLLKKDNVDFDLKANLIIEDL